MTLDESLGETPQRQDLIKIVPYDASWPAAFEEQRRRVEKALRPWLSGSVEHIGSTSVAGLSAKPIIDMLATIEEYSRGTALVSAMSRIGWVHAPEPEDATSRKWSFSFPNIQFRSHHLHVFESGDPLVAQLLVFRDHLRAKPDDVVEYMRIKTALAAADNQDRRRYRSGKAPFIEGLLERIKSK